MEKLWLNTMVKLMPLVSISSTFYVQLFRTKVIQADLCTYVFFQKEFNTKVDRKHVGEIDPMIPLLMTSRHAAIIRGSKKRYRFV